jgi:hypothetical protein
VLKLSVFKKKYKDSEKIITKNDDFIFYFGSYFKKTEFNEGNLIYKQGEVANKSTVQLIQCSS